MHAYIHDLSYALGDVVEDVDEAAAGGRTLSSPKLLRQAGFASHHRGGDGTTSYDLARRAVEPIRDAARGSDAILYATCLPLNGNIGDVGAFERTRDVKTLMDYPASHLQVDLGLDGAVVMGLNQTACTSMLGSLRVAHALLSVEESWKKILCVTADRFPPGAIYEQAFNLISDGAASCVVSKEERGFRLLSCHQITNGAGVQASDDETAAVYFNYTHRLVNETLARARLTMADIAWVVPQNMNTKAWQILSRILKISIERVFFEPLPRVAHCISGDNIINLKTLDESGRLARGDRLLLVMAGYGLNWTSVVLEKV